MALISFEDDNWVTEHDACERGHRNLQSLLLSWGDESRESPIYARLSADVRQKLKLHRADVARLGETLQRTKREQIITEAEYERRFRQIETLRSKCQQLQNQFSAGVRSGAADASASRNARLDRNKRELFSKPTDSSNSSNSAQNFKQVNWGVDSDDDELIGENGENDRPNLVQIQDRQNQLLKEQDDGLEALSKIISRQRNIAENIGNEVELQNDIIDDLAEHLDRTNDRVVSETGNIRLVDRRDSTCWYWNIIILLFVAIILIVLVG